MVASVLNKLITYQETREILPEDLGHMSSVYALRVGDTECSVVLGKLKYTYANKNIIYLPIYAISKRKIRAQIGVFELDSKDIIRAFLDEGEINTEMLSHPLLFSFVSEKWIAKQGADPKQYDVPITPLAEQVAIAKTLIPDQPILDGVDDEDAARFKVNVPVSKVSEETREARAIIDNGVFSIAKSPDMGVPIVLEEETEQEADALRESYRESATNNWIEKYMKNNHYRILENEGSGDCLFAVIRDAFKQIGRNTTVDKLRAILANEITDEVFQEQYRMFLQFRSHLDEITKEMGETKKSVMELKKRMKNKKDDLAEAKQLVEQVKPLTLKYNQLQKQKTDGERAQEDYVGYMKNIDTLDKMRAYIRTQNYWADTWAISTLERVLNMKLIIFSENAYVDKALDSVLQCGEANKQLMEKGSFSPEYYIMTSYRANHYRLVAYKQKYILTYREIPYDVKMMVLNKCLEKNAGIYYLIQDFRNLKTRLGIEPDEGRPEEEDELEGEGRLFRSATVFVFSATAEKTSKPGMADGEKITKEAKLDYVPLSKIPDWRKRLDDAWMSDVAIRIDNHNWASVLHYLEGAKYKKGYPDVYLQFSLDSGSEVAKDPKPDKAAKKLKVQGDLDKKPKALKVDVDYALGRDEQEREVALRAKFSENADMRNLLRLTKTALLKHREKRGSPASPDILLMKIREELILE